MSAAAVLLFLALPAFRLPAPLSVFSPSRRDAARGAARYREKKYGEAARDFDAARRRDPSDPAWALDLGTALGADGKDDPARSALDAAARASDRKIAADALYQSGTLALERGRNGEAADALRRSLVLDPARDDAKRNFEIAMRRQDAEKPPPKSGGENRPKPSAESSGPRPPQKSRGDSEFEKRAGMTRSEAESLLRSLDAEQRQRERTNPVVSGRDW